MPRRFERILFLTFLVMCASQIRIFAQEPFPALPPEGTPAAPTAASTPKPNSATSQIIVPAGTRLPLVLRNGVNTRVAKSGDSVYFVTAYPIAVNNHIAIPIGTFVRGEIVEAKRPGRIHGRGEFRIALEQMTFPNGYTIDLRATPTGVDHEGKEEVTPGGRVTGPGAVGKDVGTVALATVLGGPVGGYAGILAGNPSRGSVAIGHGVGLAAGLAVVLLTRGPEAELPRGTTVDSILDRPLLLDAASLPANVGAGLDPLPRNSAVPLDDRKRRRESREKRLARQPLFWPFLFPRF